MNKLNAEVDALDDYEISGYFTVEAHVQDFKRYICSRLVVLSDCSAYILHLPLPLPAGPSTSSCSRPGAAYRS